MLHELTDQRALAADVTAYAGSARTAEQVRDQLRAAFAALRGPRPRLPTRTYRSTCSPSRPYYARSAAPGPHPRRKQRRRVAAAEALLATAQRPLLIAAAARVPPAPRCATGRGPGRVPDDDRGRQGRRGREPSRQSRREPALPSDAGRSRAADVMVAAGTELAETDVYTTTRLPIGGS